ncbi:EAL domain-containing protein [Pseudarthrobacter sp. NPDC092439]|uniref:EAL domain-containing protein n=1 Tax=unclassified Pseudarthrobacter TaxID=2647000 RepID=UPI003808FC12
MSSGRVTGAEALARFRDAGDVTPDIWFSQATSVGLGAELELASMQAALAAATGLPADIYVSVNLSPETCLNPRLAEVIRRSQPAARPIVLELTERTAVADYRTLREALAVLRRDGILLAVDDAGAGFASMRHILQLAPDIIKIDREIIAGIDKSKGQYALGAAMTEFAAHVGAVVVAEGIETERELAAVTTIGMAGGQGYLLGRPSTRPGDWAQWKPVPTAENRSPESSG